jgi:hypothetical protein
MTSWKCLGAAFVIVSVLSAQPAIEDPVLKIRDQRAVSGEGDLPPVPRGVLEPPPLPAPETHVKDTRGWRASKAARKTHGKVLKKGAKARPVAARVKKLPKKKP